MRRSTILDELMNYISIELLDGADTDLDSSTRLLEWGVINSIEIIRLIKFIEATFKVEVPFEKIIPDHLQDADAIANLVFQLVQEQSADKDEFPVAGLRFQ